MALEFTERCKNTLPLKNKNIVPICNCLLLNKTNGSEYRIFQVGGFGRGGGWLLP